MRASQALKRGEVHWSVKEREHVLDFNNAVGVSKGFMVGVVKGRALNDDGCDGIGDNIF